MSKKKPFKETTVGKLLIGAVGVVNPSLGSLISGALNPTEAIKNIISDGSLTAEQKAHFKNLATELEIQEFEAEVKDRDSARNREAAITAAGGSNHLQNVIGWSITLSFLGVVLYGIGIIPQQEGIDQNYLMFASGAVTSAFMAVVSYFFGSSIGSKQKTNIINNK